MAEPGSADREAAYEVGYDDAVKSAFELRTATRDAAFLLPHLESGQALLDCGCGTGTITAGLAREVSPGPVTAIDIEASQVEVAERHCAGMDVANVTVQVASAVELPFHDESFDVVFFHAVLCHFAAPLEPLAEARRVLKPGGLVAIRDPDLSGWYAEPAGPWSERMLDLLGKVVESGGGDAHLGRRVRPLLHEAGFDPTVGSASSNSYGDSESVRRKGEVWAGLASGSAMADNVVEQGLFSRDELDQTGAAMRRLAERPDAVIVEAWGEALGWKPPRG